jgi:hypothetical protein
MKPRRYDWYINGGALGMLTEVAVGDLSRLSYIYS